MNRDQTTKILAGLTAAFPNARLEEDTPDVWRKHLAPLDFDVADRAVGQCVDNLKFFPSVAEFREFYRLERHYSPPKQAPDTEERSDEIPEWCQVWHWLRLGTTLERQAANTTSTARKVEDRPPVKMRPFPQYAHLEPSMTPYTVAEYEQFRAEWVAAGSPSVSSVMELLATAPSILAKSGTEN